MNPTPRRTSPSSAGAVATNRLEYLDAIDQIPAIRFIEGLGNPALLFLGERTGDHLREPLEYLHLLVTIEAPQLIENLILPHAEILRHRRRPAEIEVRAVAIWA